MKIGILGAGLVGETLGGCLTRVGHEVRFGLRSPAKHPEDGLGFQEAVDFADVVVVALPYGAVDSVLSGLDLIGRLVIDATNPIRWEDGPVHDTPVEGSAGEHIAALTGATVVKAFNTFGAEHLEAGHIEGRPIDALIAGDDEEAVTRVFSLCEQLALRPIHVGPLRQARATEHVAMLWIHLAKFSGHGRNIAFSLLETPE